MSEDGGKRWEPWQRVTLPEGVNALAVADGAIAVGYALGLVSRTAALIAGQTISNLGVVLLILIAIEHRQGRIFKICNWGPPQWRGHISYSLYLWQDPLCYFRGTAIGQAFPVNSGSH